MNKLLKLVVMPSNFVLIPEQRAGSIKKPWRYEDVRESGKRDGSTCEGMPARADCCHVMP
jgi:hypothetical protein